MLVTNLAQNRTLSWSANALDRRVKIIQHKKENNK